MFDFQKRRQFLDQNQDFLPAVRKISFPSSAGFFEPETGA